MPPSVPYLGATFVRQVFPTHADFTEDHLPSQQGRVSCAKAVWAIADVNSSRSSL